jgi:hypothetical protein
MKYGESIPTPVSAIFAEGGIISELPYRATVASDSSLSGIGSNKIRGQGSVRERAKIQPLTKRHGDGYADTPTREK